MMLTFRLVNYAIAAGLLFIPAALWGQHRSLAKWKVTSTPMSEKEVTITFTATIQPGWHIYALTVPEGGPMPTKFEFDASDQFILKGKAREDTTIAPHHDETFDMDIRWFENTTKFTQQLAIKGVSAEVSGTITFMACNGVQCMPPESVEFILIARTKP